MKKELDTNDLYTNKQKLSELQELLKNRNWNTDIKNKKTLQSLTQVFGSENRYKHSRIIKSKWEKKKIEQDDNILRFNIDKNMSYNEKIT